jgi:hypothetical protein
MRRKIPYPEKKSMAVILSIIRRDFIFLVFSQSFFFGIISSPTMFTNVLFMSAFGLRIPLRGDQHQQ